MLPLGKWSFNQQRLLQNIYTKEKGLQGCLVVMHTFKIPLV